MLTSTVIFILIGTSLAIPNPGFYVSYIVPCNNGLNVSQNIQQCADDNDMVLPELPDSIEKELANLCRLAPPRDNQDPQTVALSTCVREVCPVNSYLNIALRFIRCDIILLDVLPGCTFETLQGRVVSCVRDANLDETLTEAGLNFLLNIMADIRILKCALYDVFGTIESSARAILECIAEKCPNVIGPDAFNTCPVVPIPNDPSQENPPQKNPGQGNPPSNDPPPRDPPPRNPPSNDPPPRDPPPRNPPSNDPPPRELPPRDPPPRDPPSRDPPPNQYEPARENPERADP